MKNIFYGCLRYSGVSDGPFGILDMMGQEDGLGPIGIQVPEELGPLGNGAQVLVEFTILKRGKIKRNPWHDGDKGTGRPKPSPLPDYCDVRGNIVWPPSPKKGKR